MAEDRELVVDLLGEFARRTGPGVLKVLAIGLPGDREPTRTEFLRAAAGLRFVRFRASD